MTTGNRAAETDHVGKIGSENAAHEEVHSKFIDDISKNSFINRDKEPNLYQPLPEYKNGLASEKLLGIEKWAQDEKLCSRELNQDELASKMAKFAKETGSMWRQMEKHMNDRPDDFLKMSQDESMTYPRFQKLLFDVLDQKHREKIRKDIPWHLIPGE